MEATNTKRRGRPRTGTLVYTKKHGWCVRAYRDVEGESVREWEPLGTHDKRVAKIRQRRLVGKLKSSPLSPEEVKEEAKREETVREACERIVNAQKIGDVPNRLSRLKHHVYDHIGDRPVSDIINDDVEELLDAALEKDLSRQTLVHIRKDLNVVFKELVRKGLLATNPVAGAKIPDTDEEVKERAVLTDDELLAYLAWQHPVEKFRRAVLERQTMSVVSRCFGGLRTGDLHAVRYESFDVMYGRFEWGWAPRRKTRRKGGRPQRLNIPAPLRPFLRDWWERAGRPTEGLLFPVTKGTKAGSGRKKTSHAKAMRRDIARAFGIEEWNGEKWVKAREKTPRERTLLDEGQFTLPVDFHSWRRAYSQALAEANVNEQQAMALAGHASEDAHRRYLQNTTRARTIPELALPANLDTVRALIVDAENDTVDETPRKIANWAGSSAVERWPYKRENGVDVTESIDGSGKAVNGVRERFHAGSFEQWLKSVTEFGASMITAGEPDEWASVLG